ncbi:MAG: conjugal transfer protein TraF [Acidobacteriota bacterium]|nr:conjugal transfer protein TraF [Acidobacteriota bacterium]
MVLRSGVAAVFVLAGLTAPAAAQTFDTVGTRAAGMGGAFVAVADDASAVYWNPGAFASGAFFSLVLDRNSAEIDPSAAEPASSRSGLLMALGSPAVALSYYRLRSTVVSPLADGDAVRAATLITHHTGATLVQSVAPGVAVGATLKLVRGLASAVVRPFAEREALLRDRGDLTTEGSNRFDADLGLMATFGRLKAGVTVRNATAPSFRTPGGAASLTLERQARAGVSATPIPGWITAADIDVLAPRDPLRSARRFAVGTEGRIHRKAFIRGGFSAAAAGERAPAASAGVSFAATRSLLVDVQVTGGSKKAPAGWGVSGRFGY